MSCLIKLHDGVDYHPWFIKAYNSMIPRFKQDECYSPVRVFSEFFNLRLIMDTHDEYPVPVYLEFPTEEEYVMFMLRWA